MCLLQNLPDLTALLLFFFLHLFDLLDALIDLSPVLRLAARYYLQYLDLLCLPHLNFFDRP